MPTLNHARQIYRQGRSNKSFEAAAKYVLSELGHQFLGCVSVRENEDGFFFCGRDQQEQVVVLCSHDGIEGEDGSTSIIVSRVEDDELADAIVLGVSIHA